MPLPSTQLIRHKAADSKVTLEVYLEVSHPLEVVHLVLIKMIVIVLLSAFTFSGLSLL